MSSRNKYRVLSNAERVRVASGPGLLIELRVARDPKSGRWAWGLSVQVGGSHLHSFGTAWLPRADEAEFPDRDSAIAAARKHAAELIRARLEPGIMNPAVEQLCRQALAKIADSRQRRLFA